jgi:hypothetical protein
MKKYHLVGIAVLGLLLGACGGDTQGASLDASTSGSQENVNQQSPAEEIFALATKLKGYQPSMNQGIHEFISTYYPRSPSASNILDFLVRVANEVSKLASLSKATNAPSAATASIPVYNIIWYTNGKVQNYMCPSGYQPGTPSGEPYICSCTKKKE